MPDITNYEADILTWSICRAALLRRVAAGKKVNDQVDWANVVKEIEAVGPEPSGAEPS